MCDYIYITYSDGYNKFHAIFQDENNRREQLENGDDNDCNSHYLFLLDGVPGEDQYTENIYYNFLFDDNKDDNTNEIEENVIHFKKEKNDKNNDANQQNIETNTNVIKNLNQ